MIDPTQWRGYIFSRPFHGVRIPQKVQNLVIRDYCRRNNYTYLLSATEMAMTNSYQMLSALVGGERYAHENIAMYSLLQLPESQIERHELLARLIGQGRRISFCVEEILISTKEQLVWLDEQYQLATIVDGKNSFNMVVDCLTEGTSRKKNFIGPQHNSVSRNYFTRMADAKVEAMVRSKEYGYDYWDGHRRYGYGGYIYIPGYWTRLANILIQEYELNAKSRVLDVGCGKGFLLFELQKLLPGLTVEGVEYSDYAIEQAHRDLKGSIVKGDVRQPLPYETEAFDLVLCINVLHNLRICELGIALTELVRVSKNQYLVVESYRSEQELFNLQCWALTAESFFDVGEWEYLYKLFGFTGDYEFIFFEDEV